MKTNKQRRSIRSQMIRINISVTAISFVMYGILFISSVALLIGKYVKSDQDFMMSEIGSNLQNRIGYIEDTILGIRGSAAVMDYIREGKEMAKAQEAFQREVNISNAKNQGEDGSPLVEMVFLFSDGGKNSLSDFYYALASEETEEYEMLSGRILGDFQRKMPDKVGFGTYYGEYGNKLYLSCPLLDERMDRAGTLIFQVNRETIRTIMGGVTHYDLAFWNIYTTYGQRITESESRLAGREYRPQDMGKDAPFLTKINGVSYRVFQSKVGLDMLVYIGIPENQAARMLFDYLYLYVIMILIIFAGGLLSYCGYTFRVTRPIREVTEKLKNVQEGDFETKLPDYKSLEFHEISVGFNQMTTEINHLVKEVYEKQLAVKEMELKFTQAQMNPHFMFNVLNALALQAKFDGNNELSSKITTFSQLVQAKIYRSDADKVQIRQELQYVSYYLEIQKFRYGEDLSYEIQVPDEFQDYYIPKLCIQLLVENAVVHGLEPKTGKGTVKVRGQAEEEHLLITIEDDGVGFEESGTVVFPIRLKGQNEKHNQVGLNNVYHILKMTYGKQYGLEITSQRNQGTTVYVRIPFDRGI